MNKTPGKTKKRRTSCLSPGLTSLRHSKRVKMDSPSSNIILTIPKNPLLYSESKSHKNNVMVNIQHSKRKSRDFTRILTLIQNDQEYSSRVQLLCEPIVLTKSINTCLYEFNEILILQGSTWVKIQKCDMYEESKETVFPTQIKIEKIACSIIKDKISLEFEIDPYVRAHDIHNIEGFELHALIIETYKKKHCINLRTTDIIQLKNYSHKTFKLLEFADFYKDRSKCHIAPNHRLAKQRKKLENHKGEHYCCNYYYDYENRRIGSMHKEEEYKLNKKSEKIINNTPGKLSRTRTNMPKRKFVKQESPRYGEEDILKQSIHVRVTRSAIKEEKKISVCSTPIQKRRKFIDQCHSADPCYKENSKNQFESTKFKNIMETDDEYTDEEYNLDLDSEEEVMPKKGEVKKEERKAIRCIGTKPKKKHAFRFTSTRSKSVRTNLRTTLASDYDSNEDEYTDDSDKKPTRRASKRIKDIKPLTTLKLNIYDEVCEKLQLFSTPEYIPCREKEISTIYEFVKTGLINKGSSTSLYISGMPGTGKTASTLEVIKKLKKEVEGGELSNFKFLHINGMSLNNPLILYSMIYHELTNRHAQPARAVIKLDELFKKRKIQKQNNSVVNVILVDELDALLTKKQNLLYNLFDWPAQPNARLIIIGIANTMDLPERFQIKICSRIGSKRLVYEPYSRDQIQQILNSRLDKTGIFDIDALRFASMKIASLSGDIRRSLQLCKRAVEICRNEYLKEGLNHKDKDKEMKVKNVGMSHLTKAIDELFSSKNTKMLKSLSKYETIVVIGLLLEQISKKQEKVSLEKVYNRVFSMCTKLNEKQIPKSVYSNIIMRLKMLGVLSIADEMNRINGEKVAQLFIYQDEINAAYSESVYYYKFEDQLKN